MINCSYQITPHIKKKAVTTMILNDYHVHSSFSGDSPADMRTMIEFAIKKNIQNLCFTDHHDLDVQSDVCLVLDFDVYKETFFNLKIEYEKRINLRFGVELGIQPHLYSTLSHIAQTYPFDFILCSNHVANGIDPYFPIYFEGKSKVEAYREFFTDTLRNAKNYKDYDVYGHLDYVIRYGPYEDKHYIYATYQEVLDELLRTLIEDGKGIELNASGFKYQLEDSHPSWQVIKRYRELGGEIITVGSDAHRPEQLMNYFDLASDILKNAGFTYYTIFKDRKPEFIKL